MCESIRAYGKITEGVLSCNESQLGDKQYVDYYLGEILRE